MLTIGEFSNICKVSTKTLRYYAEIGLILPEEINSENGYQYYRNVAGIAQTEAQKSSYMFVKCQYLDNIVRWRKWILFDMRAGFA